MEYEVCLEQMEGGWIAHLPHPFGCFASAATPETAVAALPAALSNYQQWRHAHGDESFTADPDPQLTVVEQIREWSPPAEPDYVVNAFFAVDARPLTPAETEQIRPLLTWAYTDLVNAAQNLDAATLNRPVEGQWNIVGILNHCSRAAWWYLNQFERPPTRPEPSGWQERLQTAHDHLLKLLPQLAGDAHLTWQSGEIWSARKVLRRTFWHARDHTQHIAHFRRQLGQPMA